MPSNETRTVLTTGANSGIGLATVLELARRGYRSVGTVRSEAKAETVAKAAADAGVEVETVLLDVTDADRCLEVVHQLQPFGLVNNAGYPIVGAVEEISDEDAHHAVETMLMAPIRLARLALPYMRAAGHGRIVNVSSLAALTTTPLNGWYHAVKHGLEAVSDALRIEVASSGVKVVLVEPGGVKTNIWNNAERELEKREGSRFETGYRRTVAGERLVQPLMAEPSAVARVIANALVAPRPRPRYLVGPDARVLSLVDSLTPTVVKDAVMRVALGL